MTVSKPAAAPEAPEATETAAPAATEPAPQPQPEPESEKEEPQLVQRPARRAPFIPPKPVAAEDTGDASEPEPFAAAAMENARSEAQKERRRPSLFERMTGAGKSAAATKTPTATPEPKETAAVTPMPKPAPAPVTEQPEVPAAEADDRFQLSQAEEEMLDIPAFLRRQAN